MKKLFGFILLTLFILNCKATSHSTIQDNILLADTGDAYPEKIGEVKIAKWQDNKKAGLLMYFDDSTYGQAELAIPLLNKLKLVGTFFVNPGTKPYKDNQNIWEFESQKRGGGCQELANHTMHHIS